MKRVLGCIRRADERYGLIHDGDSICVGVSGGKDSLLLLYGLNLYRMFSKKRFDVRGVMLDLGLVEQDYSALLSWAEESGCKLEILKTDIGDVVFNVRKEKNPCALCAKFRRGALNTAARARGCNLIALGHNREDVIETFLLSLFFESRLNTFAPVTYMDRMDVTIIRPLVFFPEKEAISAARRLNLPVQKPNCPVAGFTKREDMKNLIKDFRRIVPDPEVRIMTAIADVHKYGMWDRMKLPPNSLTGREPQLFDKEKYNGREQQDF